MDSSEICAKAELAVRDVSAAAKLRDLYALLHDFATVLQKRIGIDGATPIVSEIERQIIPRQ